MLRSHLRKIDSRSKKLARSLFSQMILQGPKLEMKQLTLSRLVDIGTELAVCGLVASRVETEMRAGSNRNILAADYWIQTRLKHVDSLFSDVWKNNDSDAKTLAEFEMRYAEPLPEVDTSHLVSIDTDLGREITNGKERKL